MYALSSYILFGAGRYCESVKICIYTYIHILCRHGHPSHRPTFTHLLELLSQTEFEIFIWDNKDLIDCDPQVKVIGAPLDVANNLYPELQRSYL